jgi:hypothetical protein
MHLSGGAGETWTLLVSPGSESQLALPPDCWFPCKAVAEPVAPEPASGMTLGSGVPVGVRTRT